MSSITVSGVTFKTATLLFAMNGPVPSASAIVEVPRARGGRRVLG
ncbi:MAG TPA: hypothetical protein VHU80_07965 [Polyangiaceae bacterium]|jgi:hypothetical protein|nr:hypothetical protein [Polyangiaceae bacterium]